MEIKEVPRPPRRGLRPGDPERPSEPPADLRIEAKDLLKAVDELADLRVAMKVPLSAAAAEASAVEVVDPEASTLVANLLSPLRSTPALVNDSGVTPAALQESDERLDAMSTIYSQAAEAEVAVEQSIKVVTQVQRLLRPQVLRQAQLLLESKDLTDAQKQELAQELARIEREQRQVGEDRAAVAARTSAEQARNDAALAAELRNEEAMRTLARLRRGEAVDPAAVRSAFEHLNDRRGDAR